MADKLDTESYDIVIVGGGISGLYTAWRLATSTDFSIAVLECGNRFGGRYHALTVPGGFVADMGAMRYIPEVHRILHQVIQDNKLQTEDTFTCGKSGFTKGYYLHGKYCEDIHAVQEHLSISDEEFKLVNAQNSVDTPKDGNFLECHFCGSEALARDVTLKQFLKGIKSAGLREYIDAEMCDCLSVAFYVGYGLTLRGHENFEELKDIKGGMVSLVAELVHKLEQKNVSLLKNHSVTKIHEQGSSGYVVESTSQNSNKLFRSDRVMLACNAVGIEKLKWESVKDRSMEIQKFTRSVLGLKSWKVYLTYNKAWWEEAGFISGTIDTDLPIGVITSFGKRTKCGGYATLLLHSYNHPECLSALNGENEVKYVNKKGDIDGKHIPSQALVDAIHQHLETVFEHENVDIPDPVCACITNWDETSIGYCAYFPKPGVDHNSLYWQSLRPFGKDSEIYMLGDTFTAVSPNALYSAWSEGALLTAERVLHHYFNLKPYIPDLCLQNPWPHTES